MSIWVPRFIYRYTPVLYVLFAFVLVFTEADGWGDFLFRVAAATAAITWTWHVVLSRLTYSKRGIM